MSRPRRTQAVKDKKPFDPTSKPRSRSKVDCNQAAKVKTGAEINAAVNDYKMAHPK